MTRTKYPSINGLRAISIIMVIVCHLNIRDKILIYLEKFIFFRPIAYFLGDGYLGVNIFFVISGFLITSLLLGEQLETNTISLKNFYIRRTLRIFPAYYFILLIYGILQLDKLININFWSWISSLTYTKYLNSYSDIFTMHTWSLSVEEHFYILWPIIFITGIKFRRMIVIILIAIVPLIRIVGYIQQEYWLNDFTLFTRIDSIATGCLFALNQKVIIDLVKQRWRLVFYISIFCLFVLTYFTKNIPKYHLGWLFNGFFTSYGTMANIMIGLIMMYSIFGPKLLWFKFLNLKFVNYIGLLSYSLYLWQQLFILGINNWASKFPLNLIFITATALFSYYVIEKPFLKMKIRFS